MVDSKSVQSVVLWGGPLDFSDTNVHTLNLAKGLKRRDISLHLYTPGGTMEKEFKEAGIPYTVEKFLNYFIIDFFKFRRLSGEVKKLSPQLIHLQSYRQLNPAVKLARKLQIPLILTVHYISEELELREEIFRWVQGIIALNEEVREYLVNRLRVPKDIIRVISPGVDFEWVGETREYEQNQATVVGTIGNIDRKLSDFVKAAEILVKRNLDCQFLVAGREREKSEVVQQAKSLEILDRFTFVETLTNSRAVLPLLSIYVSTQSPRKFGQDILDAMAWGKGVVAEGMGTHFSLIKDRETGILVSSGQPDAIADAVTELIQNREFRWEMGENARQLVKKRFTLEVMIEETLSVYEKVLSAQAV